MGSPNLQLLMGQQAGGGAAPGEAEFTDHPGGVQQSWTVPNGVTSISIVLVGGGAGADGGNNGGGGGLSWINNVPVTPGTNLTVYNGKTGSRFGSGNPGGSDTNGQGSYILDANGIMIIEANGGRKAGSGGISGGNGAAGNGGTMVGAAYQSLTFGGGRGGHGNGSSPNSGKGGGGGAGGYSGNGGDGGTQCSYGAPGSGGGGGGGGGHCSADGGAGGGVGIYGEGASGVGGGDGNYASPGQGGSGGVTGATSYGWWDEQTGAFGGGCGAGSAGAGRGAVRIIWPGDERLFPSTRTANEGS